ncbi:uncharacterized protein LOC126101189 [Schistocerca cancellata]|uniref:uncharacterized protein LOC126101189 n=1 Tax=Schistocerca cancellata TaxID=274614 RepID=UPI002117B6B8|nr:uncharacterized protein LOC126101189 [Schistocerca cancellata]
MLRLDGYEVVMGPFGYGKRNVKGEEILNLCIRNHLTVKNTFFKKQASHQITRYDKLIGGKLRDTKVVPSEYLHSDYRLLVADLNYKMKSLHAVQRMPEIKEWKLKEEENKKSFSKSSSTKTERGSVEEEWNLFKISIVNSAVQICDIIKGKVKDKETSWWNNRAKDAIKKI